MGVRGWIANPVTDQEDGEVGEVVTHADVSALGGAVVHTAT